jgi:hypothetical protein
MNESLAHQKKEEETVFRTACIRYDERGTTVFWCREHKGCVLTTQHKNVTRQMYQTQVDCCNPRYKPFKKRTSHPSTMV